MMEPSSIQRPIELAPLRSQSFGIEASSLGPDRDPDGRQSRGGQPARPAADKPASDKSVAWSIDPEQSLMQLPAISQDESSQLNLHG
ncbi:MAG: hypothetical protein ACK5OB_09940 [Pirellula sp.]|jgi:hypothetical protein